MLRIRSLKTWPNRKSSLKLALIYRLLKMKSLLRNKEKWKNTKDNGNLKHNKNKKKRNNNYKKKLIKRNKVKLLHNRNRLTLNMIKTFRNYSNA